MRNRNLYRIVTYKKEELQNLTYSQVINYGYEVTGIKKGEDVNQYKIIIDRNLGMVDKNQGLIFENDIVEDNKGNKYRVEWCQEKLGFVLRNAIPDRTLESLDITHQDWKIVGNRYKNPTLWAKLNS